MRNGYKKRKESHLQFEVGNFFSWQRKMFRTSVKECRTWKWLRNTSPDFAGNAIKMNRTHVRRRESFEKSIFRSLSLSLSLLYFRCLLRRKRQQDFLHVFSPSKEQTVKKRSHFMPRSSLSLSPSPLPYPCNKKESLVPILPVFALLLTLAFVNLQFNH